MGRVVAIELNPEQETQLRTLLRSGCTPVRMIERCEIILLAAQGLENQEIGRQLGISRQNAGRWRERFAQMGIKGIEKDAPRSGRIPAVSNQVVRKTLNEKPSGATHWSRATMAKATAMSPSTVGRIWRANGLKPRLLKTFKLSNDKQFVEKLQDIVGLYLNPPERALVLSCDEKSQMQSLDRTHPGLPLKKGRSQTMTSTANGTEPVRCLQP